MNFLSHYYTAGIKDKPYYNFGLVLPDFMGVSQRGWKFTQADGLLHPDPAIPQLAQGMKIHFKTDALFHSSAFFKDSVSFIRRLFEQEEIGKLNIRLFFLGHIFLELLLDRIIVQKHPESVHDFYAALDNVQDERLGIFFKAHDTNVPDNFFEFLSRFRHYRYIFTYAEDEKLMYAINRIMGRAGQAAIPEQMLPAFQAVIKETENYLHQQGWQYMDELSRDLIA